MTAELQARDVLRQLEELLKSIPDDQLPSLSSPNSKLKTRYYALISSKVKIVSEKIIRTLSGLLASRSVARPLRVCSIGCGTGELDRVWLSKLKDQFPDLTVEYVGVDIDDTVCKAAVDNVGSLDFVTSKIYCQDIQEGLVDEVVKFDLFLSISSFYFIKTPDKVLDMCRKLTSPEGLVFISLGEQQPFLELFSRFWYRHFKYDVCFPSKLHSIMKTLDISFSENIEWYSFDLRAALQDRFSKEDQKVLLWSLTQVNTFQYPSAIVDKCIDYLEIIYKDSLTANKVMNAPIHYFVLHM